MRARHLLVQHREGRHAAATVRQAWRPTRHFVDAIARAVVTGRRGHGRRVDGFADRVAARMRNRLEAAGAPGARRARGARRATRSAAIEDATLLRLLLDRSGKYLAAWGR